jgi:hypothetical protein
MGVLNIPDGDLGGDYSLAFTDTVKLKTSTVLLDSIPTSNMGTLLLGNYVDDKLGVIKSTPFFQVGLGSYWTLPEDAIYESIVLAMPFSGYYYGDTTKSQTVEVRAIEQDLRTYSLAKFWYDQGYYSYFDNNYFSSGGGTAIRTYVYNNKTFAVNPTVLGVQTFTSRPSMVNRPDVGDTLVVRLDDNLGKGFFDLRKSGSLIMTSQSRFLEHFKGLSITSTNPSYMVGLNTTRSRIRIYYREPFENTFVRKYYDLVLASDGMNLINYNKIEADRSGTLIADLTTDLLNPNRKTEISSTLTNNETYVQSGLGIVTKLNFPGLRDIVNLTGFKQLTEVKLVLRPVRNSFDANYYLPTELVMFTSNSSNLPLRQVSPDFSSGNFEYARIFAPVDHTEIPEYVFTITQYAQSLMRSSANPKDMVLLLSTAPVSSSEAADTRNNIYKTVTRAVISGDYTARLEITYLKYNN